LLANYNRQREIDDARVGFENTEEKMVVYRDSDRYISQATLLQRSVEGTLSSHEANTSMCGHDNLEFNKVQLEEKTGSYGFDTLRRLIRRQGDTTNIATGGSKAQLATTVGNTNGCPNTKQVALVAAAVDCSYMTRMGNASNTRSNIISIYNQVFSSL